MKNAIDRRRFLGNTACYVVMAGLLQGCGGGGPASEPISIIPGPVPTPTPTPTPTPVPTPGPTPTPVPTPTPTGPLTLAFAGSSSAEQYLSQYAGPMDDSTVSASSDGTSFSTLTSGAFGKTAGTLINRATGRTIRFLRGGVGGTTLVQWAADDSPQRASLVRTIRAAGGADAILIQVGRNDAANLIVPSVDAQVALLRTLIASLRSEANVPDTTIFIGASQDLLGGNGEQHIQLGRQRLAEIMVANADPNVRYGFSTYDLQTNDNIHQTEPSQNISGARFAMQVIAWLRGTTQQRGPQVARVTLVSQTQTDIELLLTAGTDISPATGIDGFQIVPAGSTNELMITAAQRFGPTTVRLTHETRKDQRIRLAYGLDHDISDTACLRDNSSYGLPAEPYLSISL